VTTYAYDEFGRLKKVMLPGDSLISPTMEYDYYYALSQRPLGYLTHDKISTQLSPTPNAGKSASVDNLPPAPEPPSANLNRITTWQKLNENTRQEIRKWYDGLERLIRTETEVSNKVTVGTEGWVWKEDKWGGCSLKNTIVQDKCIKLGTYAVYGGDTNEYQGFSSKKGENMESSLSLTDNTYYIYKWEATDVDYEREGRDNGTCVDPDQPHILRIKVRLDGKNFKHSHYNATWWIKGKKDIYYFQGTITSQPILCGDVSTWGYMMVDQELNGQQISYVLQSSNDGKVWGQEVPIVVNNLAPVEIPANLEKNKWIRWKAYLTSGTITATPIIKGIAINWKTNTDDDLVSDVTYNTLGLQDRVYSPYVEKDGRGKFTQYVYENNPLCRVSKVVFPDNGSMTTSYGIDGAYRVVTVTDGNSRYTRTKYDRLGNMRVKEQETDKGCITNTYGYDTAGNLIKITDPRNNITGYRYDTLGRLIKKTHPDTGITEYRYDNNNNLRFNRDALHYQQGIWSGYQYDTLNRLIKKGIVNHAGNNPFESSSFEAKASYVYDGQGTYSPPKANMNCPKGNLTQTRDESGTTTYFYDSRGRVRCQQKGLSGKDYSTWYEYDSGNNLIQITDPAGRIATYTYNQLNQLVKVQGDRTGTVSYTYEPSGGIDVISFPNGITTNYDYTARNWTSVINTMNGNSPVFQRYYQYDSGGNLTQEYNAATKTNLFSKYTYDKLNRLTNTDYQPLNIPDLVYTYDECGNRLKAAVGTASARSYSYSGNRITNDGVYSYTYYPNGNLKTRSKTDEVLEYYYDYANNLIQINKNGVVLERYVYDGDGKRVEKLVNSSTNTAVSIYFYASGVQAIYEERFLVAKKLGAPSIEKDWEQVGLWHLTTARSNGSSQTWCYNNGRDYNIGNNSGVLVSPAIKLTGFSEPMLKFSSWYQTEDKYVYWDQKKVFISTEAKGYKDLKQVKQISGRMRQWTKHEVGLKEYANKRIRLNFLFNTRDAWYNNYEGWYIDDVRIEDGNGQKGPKILLPSEGSAKGSAGVIVDIQSYNADKAIANSKENTSYLYANGQMVAKVEEKPVGSTVRVYYCHNDHLGSLRAITDKNGKATESYFYYPFGAGGPVGGPSFTGKELDSTGLFYFGARYYDSALGRFISPDPVDVPGANPYVYCCNNPLRYTDPTGECIDPVTIAVVAFFIGGTHEYWQGKNDPHFDFVAGIISAGFAYCMGDMLMNPANWKFAGNLSYVSPYGAVTIGGAGIYDGGRGWQGNISYGVETPYGSYYTRGGSKVNYMGGKPAGTVLGDLKPSNVGKGVGLGGKIMQGIEVGKAIGKAITLPERAKKKAVECVDKNPGEAAAIAWSFLGKEKLQDLTQEEKIAVGKQMPEWKEWHAIEAQELTKSWINIATW
ncbi:hypothetical protein KKG56_10560, partial [bacterium]|nr:hypothetical protein [bacterium]